MDAQGIIERVEDCADLQRGSLFRRRRHRSIAWPRQIAAWIIRHNLSRSLPEIARDLRYDDHTTVLYSIRKVEQRRRESEAFAEDLHRILVAVNSDGDERASGHG